MKEFYVFYNSDFDSALQAQSYRDEAGVHAKKIGKKVLVHLVDIKGNATPHYFDPKSGTVQCVSVDTATVEDCEINPADLVIIDEMIDNL